MADGIRIVELCKNGLLPKASRGLVVMHDAEGKPTELTCTLRYKPGAKFIAGAHLVNVALCALFMTRPSQIAAMFCKSQWHTNVPFWKFTQSILESATDMPPSVETACAVDNPNVRSFVLRCWYRLKTRLGFQFTEKLLAHGARAKWPESHEWTPTLTKWMVQLQTPFAVSAGSAGDLVVSKLNIVIPKRDKIVLMLMILFRRPLGYGEQSTDNMLCSAIGITQFPQLYCPEACEAHHLIKTAIDWRLDRTRTA